MPSENIANLSWRHANKLVSLPEPPTTFVFAETDLTRGELKQFVSNNLLDKAAQNGRQPCEWVVRREVYERALDHVTHTETFPCCGSTGVTNDAGTLRCIDCGEPVTTEAVNRVLG